MRLHRSHQYSLQICAFPAKPADYIVIVWSVSGVDSGAANVTVTTSELPYGVHTVHLCRL